MSRKRRLGHALVVPVRRRYQTLVAVLRCAARQGRQPAELTHCFFSYERGRRGEALPMVTVERFDSPRPKPRPWLRCSRASKGRQGRAQTGARHCRRPLTRAAQRARAEERRFRRKTWFSSESFTGLRLPNGSAEPPAERYLWGEGRLRRETVEGVPLFVGRRGPSLQASGVLTPLARRNRARPCSTCRSRCARTIRTSLPACPWAERRGLQAARACRPT
jgi:hypothetical protein